MDKLLNRQFLDPQLQWFRCESGRVKKLIRPRILLDDDQRRRLAVKGQVLTRKTLQQVANILKAQGIEPGPQRQRRTSWQTFLNAHWDSIVSSQNSANATLISFLTANTGLNKNCNSVGKGF